MLFQHAHALNGAAAGAAHRILELTGVFSALQHQLGACLLYTSDKGYGIRAAMWAGANLDKEAAPMLFDRGIVAPGVDGGYVDSDTAFGGKAFPGKMSQ